MSMERTLQRVIVTHPSRPDTEWLCEEVFEPNERGHYLCGRCHKGRIVGKGGIYFCPVCKADAQLITMQWRSHRLAS